MPVFTINKPKLTFGMKEETIENKEAERALIKGANILPQSGKVKDYKADFSRRAKLPGKRISASGKVYWETRANRSDSAGKKI